MRRLLRQAERIYLESPPLGLLSWGHGHPQDTLLETGGWDSPPRGACLAPRRPSLFSTGGPAGTLGVGPTTNGYPAVSRDPRGALG